MTDNEIISGIQESINNLNLYLIDAAKQGIVVDLVHHDITGMDDRVRCHHYSFQADKRLIGGL